MKRASMIALCVFSLIACGKKEAPPAGDATPPSASTPTPAATPDAPSAVAAAPVAVDIDSLPVEEDFEGEAEKEVTTANLHAQLDALDKEISAP